MGAIDPTWYFRSHSSLYKYECLYGLPSFCQLQMGLHREVEAMFKKSADMPINLPINHESLGKPYDYNLSVWFIALADIPIW
jgi:hypothetical protein